MAYILLIISIFSFSYSATASATNEIQDSLLTVIQKLIPSNVTVTYQDNQVTFQGSAEAIKKATQGLHDYSAIREVLLPVHAEASLTRASQKEIKTWSDFLTWIGMDTKAVTLTADAVTDKDGVWSVQTSTRMNTRMMTIYLEELMEVPFFSWARKNIHGFVEVTESLTSIRYTLLANFLHLPEPAQSITDDQITTTWQTQDLIKIIIAATSGTLALTQDEKNPDTYRVNVMTLGTGKTAPTTDLCFYIDISGSMGDTDGSLWEGKSVSKINYLNSALPRILETLKKSLQKDQKINLKVKPFNDCMRLKFSQPLTQTSSVTLSTFTAQGGTDLNLPLRDALQNSRCLAVLMTDGYHSPSTCEKLLSIQYIEQSLKTLPTPLQLISMRVGHSTEPFLSELAQTLGMPCYDDQNMADFINTLVQRVQNLLRPKVPILLELLAGQKVQVRWVPDDKPGLYQLPDPVSAGTKITYNNTHLLVPILTSHRTIPLTVL